MRGRETIGSRVSLGRNSDEPLTNQRAFVVWDEKIRYAPFPSCSKPEQRQKIGLQINSTTKARPASVKRSCQGPAALEDAIRERVQKMATTDLKSTDQSKAIKHAHVDAEDVVYSSWLFH